MARPRLLIAAIVLGAIAIGIRVHNAFEYFTLFGFDALFHWRYVESLVATGALPDPEAGWSASRPPLFFVLAAGVVRAMGRPETASAVIAVRLLSSAIGLLPAWLAAQLVLRVDPQRPERAALAAALIVFVPAQIMMSAMFNEEILVASLTSLALWFGCRWQMDLQRSREGGRRGFRAATGLGVAAGLAAMTKLTGSLAGIAGFAAIGSSAWRAAGVAGLRRVAAPLALGGLLFAILGGAFYASHLVRFGYLYPHSLEAHQAMYQMPPGERRIGDYLRFPLSTFTDPRAVTLDLQRSVWGSTYASLWFDSHRFFTPRDHPKVTRVGTAILLLAMLPSVAFGVGLFRAARRWFDDPAALEGPMLALVAITLAGYAAYTWRNPWYATVKGGYLLGLSVPFGFLASEVLCDWARGGRLRAALVFGPLLILGLLIGAAFTFGTPLWEWGPPGTVLPGFPYAVPKAP